MITKPTVGHITGTLVLQIADGAPVDLGTIRLPLIVTRVSPEKASYMSFGIGVDLEGVRDVIGEIFGQHEGGGGDG